MIPMRRLLVGALCAATLCTTSACTYSSPMLVAASDLPTDRPLRLGAEVEVERCRRYFLGAIPIEPPYSSREMLTEARGDADLLVRISWDQKGVGGLVKKQCDVLYAQRATFLPTPATAVTRPRMPQDAQGAIARSGETPSPIEEANATAESDSPSPAAPPAEAEPQSAWLYLSADSGAGADRILGWDEHEWKAPPWSGLERLDQNADSETWAPKDVPVALNDVPVSDLELLFVRGKLAQFSMNMDQQEGESMLRKALFTPTAPGLWEGDKVRAALVNGTLTVELTRLTR